MTKMTQKWCIVSLLEDRPEGYEFDKDNWPLHVTFVGVHAAAWHTDAELVKLLEATATKTRLFKIQATSLGFLGPKDGTTRVTFIESNKNIQALHTKLVDLLELKGAKFNNPEFNRDGFIAHCTVQKHKSIQPKEMATINNLALIDMFPRQDGDKRKIVKFMDLQLL